jgi:hypothetical protein
MNPTTSTNQRLPTYEPSQYTANEEALDDTYGPWHSFPWRV